MGRLPGLVLLAWCSAAAVACYSAGQDPPAAGGSGGDAASASDDAGGSENDAGGSGGAGGTGLVPTAGTSGDNTCLIGTSCVCESGLVGSTNCVDEVETCDCSVCPDAPVDTASAFTACGGEPFGTWGSGDVDLSAAKWRFIALGGASEVLCPISEAQFDPQPFLLRLDDGGAGAVHFGGLSGSFTSLASCIEPLGNVCTDFPGCARGPCGTCDCQIVPEVLEGDEITWARTDTTLTLTAAAKVAEFEYCVQGDTLSLKLADGSDLVFVLKSGHAHGTPVACNMRQIDQCASTGCRAGVCTGSGSSCAEGTDEPSCTNRSGCTWDPTICTGTATPCELEHYGTTPGCEFTENAVCSGTPSACDTKLDINDCDATPGCYWGASVGCNGTAGECAEVPLDTCPSVDGCEITSG